MSQPRHRSKLLTVCPFILGNEFCERLAYYGLATNLVVYMTDVMGKTVAVAATQVSMFEGTCYLTPVLGAWLADSHWGRYKTIMVFSIIYMLGMAALASTALIPGLHPKRDYYSTPFQDFVFFASLYTVTLGSGGIKPNVCAFGADQFDTSIPQDKKEKQRFFNWFYFAINIGSLIACSLIVWTQENIGWGIGFAIPAVAMFVSIISFTSGSRLYRHVKPAGSPIGRVLGVLWAAIQNRQLQSLQQHAVNEDVTTPFLQPDSPAVTPRANSGMRSNASFAWLDRAVVSQQIRQQDAWEHAQPVKGYTTRQVEEVKLVLRMFPVFFTTILYWTLYAQMGTLFVQQGKHMNREVNVYGHSFIVPAASLSVFNTLSIILLIPLYDGVIEPLLRKCGAKPSLLQRIGGGMVIAAIAMTTAGAIEFVRRGYVHDGRTKLIQEHGDYVSVADLNVFWQAIPYFLVGASEVLASVGQLEFFYDQAPDVMRSCSMALQMLSVAIGSYASGALIYVVQWATSRHGAIGWLPRDLDAGHVDYYFLMLAAVMVANTLVFALFTFRYEYKDVAHMEATEHLPSVVQREPPQRPPQAPPASQPSAITISRPGRRPIAASPAASPGPYGRSVTYMPNTPVVPVPFR